MRKGGGGSISLLCDSVSWSESFYYDDSCSVDQNQYSLAQAPNGLNCVAEFSRIQYSLDSQF
jgi:hypothetical protein